MYFKKMISEFHKSSNKIALKKLTAYRLAWTNFIMHFLFNLLNFKSTIVSTLSAVCVSKCVMNRQNIVQMNCWFKNERVFAFRTKWFNIIMFPLLCTILTKLCVACWTAYRVNKLVQTNFANQFLNYLIQAFCFVSLFILN